MRIVLDTNSLIQSIPPRSPYRRVWDSIESGENTLCVTNEILEEYEEILLRLTNHSVVVDIMNTIIDSVHVELVTPYYHFNLITADPDDNKFVDCAIAAGARYVVTNDHHYDILQQISFPYVDVISLFDFTSLLNKR